MLNITKSQLHKNDLITITSRQWFHIPFISQLILINEDQV